METYNERLLTRLRASLSSTPHVLVVREKHGTAFLDASNVDALSKSCLSLLKFRRENDYYYDPGEEILTSKKPSLTKEQISALPDGAVKKAALGEWAQYKRKNEDHQDAIDFIKSVDEAIANKDGLSAYLVLKDRSDAEYERVELEPISSTYG